MMIAIWNQKEIFTGTVSEEMKMILEILNTNKIKYQCKAFNGRSAHLFNAKALSLDLFGLNHNQSSFFNIYIHKKDFDHVYKLINQMTK
jgi:hypothetical protein